MKTIGIIGGMSFESTLSYYQGINELVRKNLGGLNSAKIALLSLNFEEIAKLQRENKWQESAEILSKAALSLEKIGVDFILIATNTMHKVLPIITQQVKTPFIHIAESLGEELKNNNIKKALLLGTKFTMSESFYKDILQNFKIETIIPNNEEMEIVNSIIFDELCQGKVLEDSKKKYLQIIESYKEAEAVILGCTEIGMLIQEQDCKIKLFDTTKIHIKKAVELALK
ncbi:MULTISPECIES: aspartate/glutamate racemase family protein [Helicobacter]|uniref:Aspartate/glutamate racemase family protein n=1 Tax=Helicobacter ibis TaxID=2962633 RepID=A0ABT4VF21_9HELI|nr:MULTISPECIES: aspartate/glutamate racemase family protein [Helicobacter]MDA3967182.1 aspartate/glutamate racemase family protein [Helicobacter sp. WB40]MDA3969309.1 aspartate/glutamate racemase family protein [Helicobacter ibis]